MLIQSLAKTWKSNALQRFDKCPGFSIIDGCWTAVPSSASVLSQWNKDILEMDILDMDINKKNATVFVCLVDYQAVDLPIPQT